MIKITRRFLMLLAAGTLVFSATSASAQLRQTKLFIDGGNSNFATINAAGLGGAATVSIPSTASSTSNFILSVLAGGQTIDAGGSASVLTIGSGSTGNDITGNGWYVNHSGGITAANVTDGALTSGDVTFAGTNGLLSDDAAFTYGAATLTAPNVTASTGNITASAGNIAATLGSVSAGTTVTAGTGITSTTGNIAASSGNVSASGTVTAGTSMSAGTTVTAGTGITSTTGNIAASSGNVSASGTVTGGTGVIATTGNVAASSGNVSASGTVTAGTSMSAGTTITAGTGITATTGNIAASSGNLSASGTVTGGTGVTATTGNIAASDGNVSASGTVTAGTSMSAGTTLTAGTGLTVTTGGANITGGSADALTLTSTAGHNDITGANWSVDHAGDIAAASLNAGSGTIQTTGAVDGGTGTFGGLTNTTGAVDIEGTNASTSTINTSSTANTTIGNSTGTVTIHNLALDGNFALGYGQSASITPTPDAAVFLLQASAGATIQTPTATVDGSLLMIINNSGSTTAGFAVIPNGQTGRFIHAGGSWVLMSIN